LVLGTPSSRTIDNLVNYDRLEVGEALWDQRTPNISAAEAFRVLNQVQLRSPGKWWWHGDDIEDATAQGVIFRAYREHGGLDIGYLILPM
jgi:hypothetical protein